MQGHRRVAGVKPLAGFLRPVLGLVLLGVAAAGSGATWIDKFGRVLTLQAPGLTEAVLTTGTRTPPEAAATFKALCLDTNLDRTFAGKAAETMGFRYVAATMPFKQPVDIGSWLMPDAELSVGRDLFFAKEPQCGLMVALPGADDRAAMVTALSALIGTPVNAAKATKKDGSPDKRWEPEWVVPGAAAGLERRVFLHQSKPNQVQFAVIERKGS